MNEREPLNLSDTDERAGPAKDFAVFSELELERRRNSDQDFDAGLFHEAVALVLGKLSSLGGIGRERNDDDHQ